MRRTGFIRICEPAVARECLINGVVHDVKIEVVKDTSIP